MVWTRSISVSFLIRTLRKDSHSQASSTSLDLKTLTVRNYFTYLFNITQFHFVLVFVCLHNLTVFFVGLFVCCLFVCLFVCCLFDCVCMFFCFFVCLFVCTSVWGRRGLGKKRSLVPRTNINFTASKPNFCRNTALLEENIYWVKGLFKLLDVLPAWANPGSCSPSDMIRFFQPSL